MFQRYLHAVLVESILFQRYNLSYFKGTHIVLVGRSKHVLEMGPTVQVLST